MQTQKSHYHDKALGTWSRIVYRLLYLPGALVLIYGFWLSLTV